MIEKIKIIQIFKWPGESEQKNVIKSLAVQGESGLKTLIEIWDETNSVSVKRWIVEALGEFINDTSKGMVCCALKDKAMSVRLHAIRATEKFGCSEFGKYLLPLVDDESGGIRMNVLDAIFRLKVKGYKRIIKKLLTDEKKYIRKRAEVYEKSIA